MPFLIVRLREDAGLPVEWAQVDADRAVEREGAAEAWNELSALSAGRRVIALAPAPAIRLLEVQPPARNVRQLRQAIPYTLEESLAGDVEDLHFALGPMAAERVAVAIVARARLDAWLAALRGHGLDPEAVVPEVLLLPSPGPAWSAAILGTHVAVRTGPLAGFGIDLDGAAHLLRHWPEPDAGGGRALRLFEPAGSGAQPAWPDGLEVERVPTRSILGLLARSLDRPAPLNLLQGPYARTAVWAKRLRPWRAAAGFALAWIVVATAGSAWRYHQLGREEARLQSAIEATYRGTFPDAVRVVDARAQMNQRLTTLRDRAKGEHGGLLGLLGAVGRETRAGGVEIRALHYRPERLEVDLSAADLKQLEALRRRLVEGHGLTTELRDVQPRNGRSEGRMVVERRS